MSLQSCLLSQEARHPPSPPYLALRDGSLIIVQNVCYRKRTKSPPTSQASLATPATHAFCLPRQAPLVRLMDVDRGGRHRGMTLQKLQRDQVPSGFYPVQNLEHLPSEAQASPFHRDPSEPWNYSPSKAWKRSLCSTVRRGGAHRNSGGAKSQRADLGAGEKQVTKGCGQATYTFSHLRSPQPLSFHSRVPITDPDLPSKDPFFTSWSLGHLFLLLL